MQKSLLLLALFTSSAVAAETYRDIFKIPYIRYVASAEGSFGIGNLDWSVAKDITGTVTPNILSELKFNNLELLGHGVKGEIWITEGPIKNTYLAMRAHHSAVNRGRVTDSDFAGNNRSGEYLRTESDATGDKTYEIDSELGYQFSLADKVSFIPTVGLNLKSQRLRIGNPVTMLDQANPDHVGEHHYSYLDSTYFNRWEGMSLGGQLTYSQRNHAFTGYARYYKMDYKASANWNLRKDFAHPDSFEHSATGDGYSVGARYACQVTDNWALAFELVRTQLATTAGLDRVNFANGSEADSRLNEVNWSSTAGMISLQFHH